MKVLRFLIVAFFLGLFLGCSEIAPGEGTVKVLNKYRDITLLIVEGDTAVVLVNAYDDSSDTPDSLEYLSETNEFKIGFKSGNKVKVTVKFDNEEIYRTAYIALEPDHNNKITIFGPGEGYSIILENTVY